MLTKKKIKAYCIEKEKLFSELNSSANGLSEKDVNERLIAFGKNEILSSEKESALKLFIEQFKDILILILIISSIISFSVGQIVEASAIIIIVILAGILGFIQEFRAGKAIEALKRMSAPKATVIREGKEQIIDSLLLVPGDIIVLNSGNTIPADARIIESHGLQVNEAPLTGESLPVEKNSDTLDCKNIPLAERFNMLFSGTFVTRGRAKAIIVATGNHTEFGEIAKMLQDTTSRKTPLQQTLDELGKKLGVISILLAFLLALLGFFLEEKSIIELFIWGVAIAVAVIPEALPAVVTISIALGVRRMAKRRALIRKLPAVETLGSIDIICSDKTGTLTQDQMTIREIFVNNTNYFVTGNGYKPNGLFRIHNRTIDVNFHHELKKLLEIGVLCNDTNINYDGNEIEVIGDPTEAAFIVAASKAGIDYKKRRENFPRVAEIPFTSEAKMMITAHKIEAEYCAYIKGAFEIILEKSTKILINGIEKKLTDNQKLSIKNIAYKNSEKAQRVLGIAYKRLGKDYELSKVKDDFVFVGFVGMIDPPREEAKHAIQTAFDAGIKPVMITGDYEVTAVAIAREVGILKHGNSIAGPDLENLNDEELLTIVDETEVFARISPKHKLKIVDALMKKNHIVAMTGDGVNDAPALKRADIGVAMGIKGTDVSREAADMILTDDNFASIVAAIEEGRGIFQNIRKYLVYLLSGNLGTVLALIIALLTALPIPLTAVQILFINFLMDGLIAIALGVEPPEKGLMKQKPRNVSESVLNKQMIIIISSIGILIAIVTLGIFTWGFLQGFEERKLISLFFVTLIFARLFNALNCRSFKIPALALKFYNNKFLIISYVISVVSTILVVQMEIFNEAFNTMPLTNGEWLLTIFSAIWVWIIIEIYKSVFTYKKAMHGKF